MSVAVLVVSFALAATDNEATSLDIVHQAMERVVKVYGAGGVGRIEAFGSAIMVADDGWLLTVYSPLLDTPSLRVVFADGIRLPARLVAVDRIHGIAMLKVEAQGLPYFDLNDIADSARAGDVIWSLSNLFGIAAGAESVSVQQGVITAVAPLSARRGISEVTTTGDAYILDTITNNPGAGGGAVIDAKGRLLAIIGKELQSTATGTWVNYALPITQITEFVANVRSGTIPPLPERKAAAEIDRHRLATANLRGLQLLPAVLEEMPAFIDRVEPGSAADDAGLKPDDLVMFVGDVLIQSSRDVRAAFIQSPPNEKIRVVVSRDEELVSVELAPAGTAAEETR